MVASSAYPHASRRRLGAADAIAIVAQVAVVGAMVGSLVAIRPDSQNGFVAVGAAVGALVGWRAGLAETRMGLFAWDVLVGIAGGELLLVPIALRFRDPVLFLSGASLGVFMAVPLFLLTLPAFHARGRALRARDGSLLRRTDTLATWGGSGATIALLAWAGQPSLFVHDRRVDLSLAFVALSTCAGLATVVLDARTLAALRRTARIRSIEGTTGAVAPPDVGVGVDTFEHRIPPDDPFRSAERVTQVNVGDVSAARRELLRSLAVDTLSFAFALTVLVLKATGR